MKTRINYTLRLIFLQFKCLQLLGLFIVLFSCLYQPVFAQSDQSAVFIVNSSGDDADGNIGDGYCDIRKKSNNNESPSPLERHEECTLRAAIQEANFKPDKNTINFNIPDEKTVTIKFRDLPGSALYSVINNPVIIDGFTQQGEGRQQNRPDQNASLGPVIIEFAEIQKRTEPEDHVLFKINNGSEIKGLTFNRSTKQQGWFKQWLGSATVLEFKLLLVIVLSAFLPVIAVSFLFYRDKERQIDIDLILTKIGNENGNDKGLFYLTDSKIWYLIIFMFSACFVSIISVLGLTTLLLGDEIGLAKSPTFVLGGIYKSDADFATVIKYQEDALLVYGMAFLGAYLWGLQNIFRRFVMNDLIPAAFYGLGIRMIFASLIALLIYHSIAPAPMENAEKSAGDADFILTYLPAIAFLVGFFPQRGLYWLSAKITIFNSSPDSAVRSAPLDMIEGISGYDKLRLEEVGIESCYDLANVDFIPMFIKLPYGARELIDWILQAKLCTRFADNIKVLRFLGIRTIVDLQRLNEENLKYLAKESPLTEFSLEQAVAAAKSEEHEIKRLVNTGKILWTHCYFDETKSVEKDS